MLFAIALSPALWVPALVLIGAAAWDLVTREIPHAFPLALLAWAVASRLLGYQQQDWGSAALGLATGLAIGLALFALGWMGAGDGKLFAGLGAILGPVGILVTMPWIAMAGGVWAFVAQPQYLRLQRAAIPAQMRVHLGR